MSKMAFDIYALNRDIDSIAECIRLDPITYYGMNMLDYLVGNTDRHPENWGFMVNNKDNRYFSLYPIMDFNQSFNAYDTLDGALCQTALPRRISQRQAAIEAVQAIGLRQKQEIDLGAFDEFPNERNMFVERLNELKKYES